MTAETSSATPRLSGLSVIIPSYRSRFLGPVLEAAKALGPQEIIVVDSSPEPAAVDDPSVMWVRPGHRLAPGAARNLGARRASGRNLLFIDADVVLTPEARTLIQERLQAPLDGVVTGIYDLDPGAGFASRLQNHILRYRILQQAARSMTLFSSSHFLVKKEVFNRIGGFNEELWTYEDVEFPARSLHLGVALEFNPRMKAIHLKEYSFAGLVHEYFLKAFNAFQARRRYRHVFRTVGAADHLSAGLALTWTLGALLIPIVAALTVMGVAPQAVAIVAALILLAPLPLLQRILAGESPGTKLAALLAWPCIGSTVAVAAAASVVVWYGNWCGRTMLFFLDLARAAKRVVIRNGLPVQIIAYVTARCNLRCEHCFYKETLDAPDSGELSLDAFERTARSVGPVLWFSLGGGEPFVRKDLDKVIDVIQTHCRPKVFSFPTNGWYTEKTYETSLRVLQRMQGGNLILFFSLDGPKDIHDEIRGAGSFDRVKATMTRLRPLTKLYPNLYLNVITTITDRNAHAAAGFIEEIVHDFEPSAVSINLFRYHTLEHPPLPAHVIQGYEAAVSAYSKYLRGGALKHYGFFGGRVLLFKEILQKELILRVAKFNEFVTPCTAGTLSYVIMEDGRVLPCEILADAIGNVAAPTISFADMVKSPQARSLRKWIVESECKCTYECAMSTNTLFSWPMSRRLTRALVGDLVGIS